MMNLEIYNNSLNRLTIEQLNVLINQLWEAMDSNLDTIKKIQLNQLITKCHTKIYLMKKEIEFNNKNACTLAI